MGKYKKWNMNELQFIADNEKLLKDSDIAAKLTKITGENDYWYEISFNEKKGWVRKNTLKVI